MLNPAQIKKIREFIENKPVEVVYLFGSQAGEKPRLDSDYDFGVLFASDVSTSDKFELRLEIMGFLTGLLNQDGVDVLDLESSPIRFQYEAIKPRGEIYIRNGRRRDEFEYKVLTNYLDEMYFMKQTTREVLFRVANRSL